jgi:ferritin-like metal-binding protein YciE
MELLHTELSEIYSAENQLMKAAPRISKAIDSETVRELMNRRLEQGEQLIADLENIFEEMNQNPDRKKNVAAQGLLRDTLEHTQEIQKGPSLDAVLIGAVQKLQHYCIAAWGTSRAFAEALGQETTVTVMQRVLEEGKELDEEFTRLAEEEVNPAMLEAGQEMDDGGHRRGRRGSSGDEARA